MSSRRKDREIFEIVTFIRGPSAGPLQTGMCSLDVGIKSAGWSRGWIANGRERGGISVILTCTYCGKLFE
jgi:hypothetical protein